MDSSVLDFSPGIAFSSEVLSLLGCPVISPFPDEEHSFWLIASFARSKLKIDEHNVGLILQSILGGVASEFAVVEIQDWMFKFTFFSRDVGLLVYKLGIVSNSIFKLSFNLWNERGMNLANSFISTSLGTHHPWIPVRSKKDNCTYAAVARSTPPLSGANRVPLGSLNQTVNHTDAPAFSKSVFSRLNSDDLCRIFSPWERLSSPAKNTGFNSKSF